MCRGDVSVLEIQIRRGNIRYDPTITKRVKYFKTSNSLQSLSLNSNPQRAETFYIFSSEWRWLSMISCFILPHSSLTSLVTLLQSSLMVTRFSWSPLDTDQGLAGYSQCRGSGGRSAVTQVSAPPLPLLNCSARVTCPEHRS